MPATLTELLDRAAQRRPGHVAVEEPPSHQVTWQELSDLADTAAAWFAAHGVTPGDRVGVYLTKSIDAVAAQYGAMRAGAAYVPVDAHGPPARAAGILADCTARAVVTTKELAPQFEAELKSLGAERPALLVLDGVGGGTPLKAACGTAHPAPRTPRPKPDDLAYILYTSGSTGKPKGVMLTHHNALAFVAWCVDVLGPNDADRFSSHAPFHFDLSILDLYVPAWQAATVVLITADAGKEPKGLADLIAQRKLTIWYSTPTILSALAQAGKPERHTYDTLRWVLFAGEVFPPKHLRHVKQYLPGTYANLYGPTETNVCTWYVIPEVVPEDRTEPYPIGEVCRHLEGRIVYPDGQEVQPGDEGELLIAGGNVMQGYWNLPERTAQGFVVDPGGKRWYKTGDVVVDPGDGVLVFVGRRDRMVKRRGYRIELGEIEAALYRNPAVREAAVVATKDATGNVRITAHLALKEGETATTITMKKFSAEALPMYMVPDGFAFHPALPKTSTDKTDYQKLAAAT